MDYLKFNCYDLATQNTELQGVFSKMRNLSEDLDEILNALDSQIKSYENLQTLFAAANKAVADSAVRVLKVSNALDEIIDLYYAAESRVLQAAEELPIGILPKGKTHGVDTSEISKVSISSINKEDIVVEDWLAELVYKSEGYENNR